MLANCCSIKGMKHFGTCCYRKNNISGVEKVARCHSRLHHTIRLLFIFLQHHVLEHFISYKRIQTDNSSLYRIQINIDAHNSMMHPASDLLRIHNHVTYRSTRAHTHTSDWMMFHALRRPTLLSELYSCRPSFRSCCAYSLT